jgi:hypothetical protein
MNPNTSGALLIVKKSAGVDYFNHSGSMLQFCADQIEQAWLPWHKQHLLVGINNPIDRGIKSKGALIFNRINMDYRIYTPFFEYYTGTFMSPTSC